ncbi:MAG: hypothetical protein EP335_13350 [Alphaproteobacteria bacterium]|nr:MAG: hypothetical protein EP335_13350 [Alphaproteobacteria bacterium]
MTTDTDALTHYLHTHIPVSRALGITVAEAGETVVVRAPFAPNINHKNTVFGGSLQVVATLACWTLLHVNARPLADGDIVISRSNISYISPVTGDFEARASLPESAVWRRFVAGLERHGKARIALQATIENQGRLAVDYRGTFALVPHATP